MVRVRLTVLFIVGLAFCLVGMVACTPSEEGWDVPHYNGTGVEPPLGNYASPDLPTPIQVVERQDGLHVRFSRDGYAFHEYPIVNGAFYGEWGQIDGTHCPTDAFCISGHFTSPTSATGSYRMGVSCRPAVDITVWMAGPITGS